MEHTLFFNTSPATSQREKELFDSERKSHAARCAHARRRAKRKAEVSKSHHKDLDLLQTSYSPQTTPINEQQDDDGEDQKFAFLSPTSLHKEEAFDPFNSFPVVLSRDDHSILRFFLRFSSANIHRAESMAKSQSLELDTYRPFVEGKIFVALTQEAGTFALLGITAARMSHMNISHHTYHKQATYYIACALNKFRRDLAEKGYAKTPDIVKVMFRLASAEWYRGEHRVARIHMTCLARMLGNNFEEGVTIMGEEYFVSNISRYDIMMAAEWDTKPLLYPPPRMSPMTTDRFAEIQHRVDHLELDVSCGMSMGLKSKDVATLEDSILRRERPFLVNVARSSTVIDYELTAFPSRLIRKCFASGFRDLVQQDALCAQFKSFLLQLFPQWSDMLLLCFSDQRGTSAEDAAWFDERANMALYDLLILQEHTTKRPRQNALRLTLIMILTDMTSPVHWRAVARGLQRLKWDLELLEALEGSFNKAYCPTPVQGSIMLWILCIALCVATGDRENPSYAEELEWWKHRAVSLCMLLQVYQISDLFLIMVKYLHCGLVRHTSLVDLMHAVAARVAEQKHIDVVSPTIQKEESTSHANLLGE